MAKQKAVEFERVTRTSIQQMWFADLDAVEKALDDLYAQDEDKTNEDQERSEGPRPDKSQLEENDIDENGDVQCLE